MTFAGQEPVASRVRLLARRIRRRWPAAASVRPRGVVDHPRDGQVVPRGPVVIHGWAEFRGRPATQIQVLVNGQLATTARPEVSRPDVANALRIDESRGPLGWAIPLDLSRLRGPTARVTVIVSLTGGRTWVVGSPLVSTLAPPVTRVSGSGSLDAPTANQSIIGDVVPVQGWSLFECEVPAWVDVEIDGQLAGRARTQLPRPDVFRATSMPSALVAGFEYLHCVDLSPGESHAFEIGVKAHHECGSTWVSPRRRVVVTAPGPLPSRSPATRPSSAEVPIAPGRKLDDRRLLVFTHSLAPGGGQLFLHELVKGLHTRHGLTCSVVAPTDGALRTELEAAGIPVRIVGDYPVKGVQQYEDGIRRLRTVAREFGGAVALANTLGVFPAVDAALREGMEVVWTIHESFSLQEFAYLNWGAAGLDPAVHSRWLETLRSVPAAVFECESTSRLFSRYIPDSRRVVVPYGIPLAEIDVALRSRDRAEARRSLGIPADALVLLSMAVYEPRKGQASLVEAFARIAQAYPKVRLALVGHHPSDYANVVSRLVELHGLGDRVKCAPIAVDVYDWYVAADALISASDVESVPRSMLEAIAFRLPVIAADAYGVSELIRNGRNGWTFPRRDLALLTAAMVRFVTTSAEERRQIVVEARRSLPLFDATLYVDDYNALIRSLARRSGTSPREVVARRSWRLQGAEAGFDRE